MHSRILPGALGDELMVGSETSRYAGGGNHE